MMRMLRLLPYVLVFAGTVVGIYAAIFAEMLRTIDKAHSHRQERSYVDD